MPHDSRTPRGTPPAPTRRSTKNKKVGRDAELGARSLDRQLRRVARLEQLVKEAES